VNDKANLKLGEPGGVGFVLSSGGHKEVISMSMPHHPGRLRAATGLVDTIPPAR
jgi:hypothetical protein